MPATFSEELEQLVRKHLAAPPQWGDDFFPLLDALEEASVRKLHGRFSKKRRDPSRRRA